MPTRPAVSRASLRPFSPAEIERRLEDVVDAVSRLTRGGDGVGPRALLPSDLVRCLAPLLSRN